MQSDESGPGGGNVADNNTSSESSGNSGSQYALCALGVGLLALGTIMIVWSVVPADTSSNSSSVGEASNRKNKASSVAFVLVASGVAMLLLSLCVGMRNKQREQQQLQEAQNRREALQAQRERETTEEHAQRYAVPSYEEAVGGCQYPAPQDALRPSVSQLPSYEDLVKVDGVQFESEDTEGAATRPSAAPAAVAPAAAAAAAAAAASTSNRRAGKNSRKLLPIKIRRIKSEKMHMKNVEPSQPAAGLSLEPLTPPPQYEDKVPPI